MRSCACSCTPPLNSSVPWQSASLWTSASGQWETYFPTHFTDDYWQEINGETGPSWGSIPDSPVSHWLGLLLVLLCPHLPLIMLTSLPFLYFTSNPPPSFIIWKCFFHPPIFLLISSPWMEILEFPNEKISKLAKVKKKKVNKPLSNTLYSTRVLEIAMLI